MYIYELIKQCSPETIAATSIRLGYFDTSLAIASYKRNILDNKQGEPAESDESI